MLVIIASSIALAAEDPVDPNSARNIFLGKMDYGFTCIFAIEVCLKVRLKWIIILTKFLVIMIIRLLIFKQNP